MATNKPLIQRVDLEKLSGFIASSGIEGFKMFVEQDLYSFAKYMLEYKDLSIETHGEICSALMSENRRKLVVMPRGSLKSTLCSISWPIWLLIKNPNLRIMVESETFTNSVKFIREIKAQMECNIMLKALFGEFVGPIWNDAEIVIKQRTQPRKESSITASSISSERTGNHFDVIILDDMNSPTNSNTEEGRQKVIDHYKMLTSILEPNGTLAVVGTRYHMQDLIGNVLDEIKLIENDQKNRTCELNAGMQQLICNNK